MNDVTTMYLADADGRSIHEENARTLQNPASLTKLATLYVTFRDLDLGTCVTVPESAVVKRRPNRVPQSNMNLKPGQSVSVMDLVLGMIVPSANDAARTVEQLFDTADFPAFLTAEMRALGLRDSTFASSSGIGEGVTSARDVVTMTRRLWEDFPQYRSLFSVGSFGFNGKRYKNTNSLVLTRPDLVGMKTGTTKTLRRNISVVFNKDGQLYVGVVLNAADRKARDKAVLALIERARPVVDRPAPKVAARLDNAFQASSIDHDEDRMGLLAYPMIWTVPKLADFLGAGLGSGAAETLPVTGFTTSAQHCQPGDVYVPASSSEKMVGKLVARARENGAAAVICPGDLAARLQGEGPVIEVPNMEAALRKLAKHSRDAFTGKVVGVTGSVGKTTTKDMLGLCLGFCGPTHCTTANLNSGNANLAAVASIPRNAAYSVLEISLMGPGAVGRKSRVARPDVSVITSIGVSHGVHQGGDVVESVLQGKTEMFPNTVQGGTAVLPSGDKNFANMVARARASGRIETIVSCGSAEKDTVRLVKAELHPTFSRVSILVDGQPCDYVIGQPGGHFVKNSLLVAGALLALGAPLDALSGLVAYAPTGRRVERFRVDMGDGRVIELIDDAYNAAPDSVRALLELLELRKTAARRVLVLGDMLELGAEEERMHLDLIPDIEKSQVDLLITVGPNTQKIADGVKTIETLSFPDARSAASKVAEHLRDRDLVAVKGSNGMDLIRVVRGLRGPRDATARAGMDWSIEAEG